jgi:hypothetical protein
MTRVRFPLATVLVLLVAPAVAHGARGPDHHMYVTGNRSAVRLRMLTGERLTWGSITFDSKCAGGDISVKIRRGLISHRQASGGLGVRITGRATTRALTGTLESWGPGCSLSRPFTARRVY